MSGSISSVLSDDPNGCPVIGGPLGGRKLAEFGCSCFISVWPIDDETSTENMYQQRYRYRKNSGKMEWAWELAGTRVVANSDPDKDEVPWEEQEYS